MMAPRALTLALLVLATSGNVACETFTSPNYPAVYPPGSILAKSFKLAAGLRPRVILKTLSLTGTDSLTIAEGSASGKDCYGTEIKRYSGVNQPKPGTVVFSVGAEVCIAFDGTKGNGKGFEVLIEGIPLCDGKYQDVEESDIISPRYPKDYPWKSRCKWQVIVPPGQHISFKVYAFDLEPGCSKAYITISNIKGYSSSKQFCDKEIANKRMESTGSSDVYFWSRDWKWLWDPDYPGWPGFRIHFTVLGCKKDDLPATDAYGTHTNPQPLYNANDVAKFECNDGYRYSNGLDELALTCESDKKWHQVAEAPWPTCVQIKCPKPGGPKYGDVKFDSEVIGSKATYTCDKNFNLVGESVQVCQKDGTWNGTAPVCQYVGSKDCQEIGDPAFGQVIGNGSSTNSVLVFECHKGYTLNGPANITCQAGTWSGRKPTCDVVRCPPLTVPLNGDIQNVDPVYQAVVTYTCKSGYRLVNHTDGKRECLETGSWSGPEPSCEVIACPRPIVHHGNVTYDSLMIGGQANFTCDMGYEMTGAETAVCLPTGEWSVPFIPLCFGVRCPPLVNLTNADADWAGNAYGDVVTVKCRSGFFFDQDRSVNQVEARCTVTKEWSGNATQGCLFVPLPTTPPIMHVTTTNTVTVSPMATQTTAEAPTTISSPITSPESISTSAAVKDGTTSETVTGENSTITAKPSSTGKVFTVEPNSTEAVTSSHLTTGAATTENVNENMTAGVTPTRNYTTDEPRPTTVKPSSTAAVNNVSTVSTGNSTLSPEGNGTIAKQTGDGKDKSVQYIGIGVGCALLVIVLVVVAVWYFRKANAGSRERFTNDDETGTGAFENQLYDLDSVNTAPEDKERAQASFHS